MTLNDRNAPPEHCSFLAKFSTTQSIARPLCGGRVFCRYWISHDSS